LSKGGMNPSFSKVGKTWRTMGHINSHLGQLDNRSGRNLYAGCDLVVVEVVEKESTPIDEILAERVRLKQEKEEAQQRRWQEQQLKQKEQDYIKLKKELGYD